MSRRVDERTDRELLEAIRSGDQGAKEAFARRHARWAVDYARRKGAGDLAEDVAQEVLHNLTNRPPIDLRDSTARAYMRTCILREIRDETARIRTHQTHRSVIDPKTSPSSAIARLHAVQIAVSDLATDKRDLLAMRYGDGLKYSEIAAETGRTAGTLRSDLRRTLAALRSKISL